MPRVSIALLLSALAVAATFAVVALTGGDQSPRRARAGTGHVGPGPVARTVAHGPYRVAVRLSPNRPTAKNRLSVRVMRAGHAVTGAKVTAHFAMVVMDMGNWTYRLREGAPGLYARRTAAPMMAGDWSLGVRIRPPGGAPFTLRLVDRAGV